MLIGQKYWLLVLGWCLLCGAEQARAQQTYELKPDLAGGELADFNFLKDLTLVWADTVGTEGALSEMMERFRAEGYLTASADQVKWRDSQLQAKVTPGEIYSWAEIDDSEIDDFLLDKANINVRRQSGKKIIPAELIRLENKLIEAANSNGHPFPKVFLDSVQIEGNGIRAKLQLAPGPLFTFGPVRLINPVNISSKYLQQYLGIPIGSLYDQDKIEEIINRIKELPFLETIKNPTVSFVGKKAVVNLFLRPKKASRWDAILGYLPRNNSANPDENEKDLFTLSLLADANNQLGLGEKMYFKFEQLQPQRQEMEIKLSYPYAFGLPFGATGDFSIYRRDSLFTDINSELGIQYLFSGNNFIKVFWENRITNLGKVDSTQVLIRKELPDQLDTRNALFGIEWQQSKLNYRFNPRSGWAVKLRSGFGLKNIRENNMVLELERDGFSPRMLYDSLNQQSYQIRLQGELEYYIPIGTASTVKTSIRSGVIVAESDIFRNEQYRIGGNQLLRGFDEDTFNASTYVITTLEYRILLSTNSALFAFGDLGYIEDVSVQSKKYDLPIGIGAGITFETKVGIFGFSLAVGRQRDFAFDLRRVKTHFGYVSLF